MSIWLVRAIGVVCGCGVGACIGYPLAKREVRKRNAQARREAIGMNVRDLIDQLQNIENIDPDTEVLASVSGALQRQRSVEGVEYLGFDKRSHHAVAILLSPQFIDLTWGSSR